MARWLKRSMSGWKPCPLSHTTPPEQLARQASEYVAWLAKARGWDTTQANDYAIDQARGELLSSTVDVSRVLERKDFGHGVTVRKIVTYDKGEHYAPCGVNAGWQRFGGYGYWPKAECPTIYEVQLNGRRVDGFLTVGRANALAKSLVERELRASLSEPPRLAA